MKKAPRDLDHAAPGRISAGRSVRLRLVGRFFDTSAGALDVLAKTFDGIASCQQREGAGNDNGDYFLHDVSFHLVSDL